MSTRKSLIQQVARELGWRTGSITSGGATSVVLDGYYEGDSAGYVGWTIWMPDAANTADKARVITGWAPTTLTATIDTRSDTTYTSETYILVPPGDIGIDDIETAINDSLAEIRQTVRSVIPTLDNERYYRLGRLSWVRYTDDVDAVWLRESPNLLTNSQFDAWGAGESLAPSNWTLAGSNATIARASTGIARGYYGAALTRVGADATLTQLLGMLNGDYASEEITLGCWVRATVANRARIGIGDGTTTSYSSYHTGGGADEWLTVTMTPAAAMTALSAILSVDTGNTSATFSNAVLVLGDTIPDMLKEVGDQAYREKHFDYRLRQVGDQVLVETAEAWGKGRQLVVVSGQPYPALSSDSDSTDCPDSIILHGAIDQVVSRMRKGQARDRLEPLRARHHREFMRLSGRRRERPSVEVPRRAVVFGA